ncbi:hypothetical protein B0H16DRAFT_1729041 [Mycena metata]|uniref:Uncharacterized protein n=1 Tax=Mycena metata TaxID=1033252 RepID=A0AAD7IF29_9AGAR|nr:hypothetical protein B0H16DRAFT_1729041 [Mycena metata]
MLTTPSLLEKEALTPARGAAGTDYFIVMALCRRASRTRPTTTARPRAHRLHITALSDDHDCPPLPNARTQTERLERHPPPATPHTDSHKRIRGPRRRISPRRSPPCITKLPPSVQAHIPSDLRTSHALIKPTRCTRLLKPTPRIPTTTLPHAPPLSKPISRISRTPRPRAPDVCDAIAAAGPHPADSRHVRSALNTDVNVRAAAASLSALPTAHNRAPPTAESTAHHALLTRPVNVFGLDSAPITAILQLHPAPNNASASPHPAPSLGASLHLDADTSASWVRFAFAVHDIDIVRW